VPKQKFIGAEHVREVDLTMGVEILDTNKTLFVAAMNDQAGDNPQPIQCKTMSEVFNTFRPQAEISVETEDGSTADADIKFNRVSDFLPENVIAQSAALKAMNTELLLLKDLMNQLRNNKSLRKAVDSPDREVLIKGIQAARAAIGAQSS
jgi:predicted component of type VI protein secretion system